MKNKNNKKNTDSFIESFSTGGDILSIVNGLSPLLNLAMPGLGTAVGTVSGIAGGMVNKNDQQKQLAQQNAMVNPSQYNNPSAFGYAQGGQINSDSFEVTGGKGQLDGNLLNYKGQNIKLDYGETLDTSKDRVMSDRIINPRTGNSFAKDDKKIKNSRAQSEKLVEQLNDPVAKATIDIAQKMEDSLFNEQELNKILEQTKSNSKTFDASSALGLSSGGNIPINKNYSMDWENPELRNTIVDPIDSQRLTPNHIGYVKPGPLSSNQHSFYNLDGTKRTVDLTPTQRLSSINMPSSIESQTASPDLLKDIPNILKSSSLAKEGFLDNLTLGEKIGAGSGLASLSMKAIEAFQPYKKQEAYINNTPIEKMQLDATDALRQNDSSYIQALSDAQNQTSSFGQRQAYAQSLYANKLKANNEIMQNYAMQNKQYNQQYNQQMSQRKSENNAAQFQAEQITEANRAAKERMRMGLYGDIATMGMNLANLSNNKYTQDRTLNILKQLNPDVYKDVIKTMNEDDERKR